MSEETVNLKTFPITRAELIEKVIEVRASNFDSDDIDESLRYGRYGFAEFSNEELQQFALDMLMEEDGEEVQYLITDADTSKPNPEALVLELIEIIKDMRKAFYVDGKRSALLAVMERSKDLIAKSEGRQS